MIKKRRGISPVVAIVILIAVAVALGIAVAFWATGLIGTLGKVEKLEIRTAYAEINTGNPFNGWKVTLSGANTGTADVTIVEITINGKPISHYNSTNGEAYVQVDTTKSWYPVPAASSPASVNSGKEFSAVVYISNSDFTSGQTIEIALVSGSGTAFKRTVVLP